MDIKLFLVAFATIFLAELGDKTQLATLAFAAGGESKLSVFLGEALGRVLPVKVLHLGAGAGLVVIGVAVIAKEFWK